MCSVNVEKCQNCKFWKAYSPKNGACRRCPPTLCPSFNLDVEDVSPDVYFYAQTEFDEWCGEWQVSPAWVKAQEKKKEREKKAQETRREKVRLAKEAKLAKELEAKRAEEEKARQKEREEAYKLGLKLAKERKKKRQEYSLRFAELYGITVEQANSRLEDLVDVDDPVSIEWVKKLDVDHRVTWLHHAMNECNKFDRRFILEKLLGKSKEEALEMSSYYPGQRP